jgi:hypothetical protein
MAAGIMSVSKAAKRILLVSIIRILGLSRPYVA